VSLTVSPAIVAPPIGTRAGIGHADGALASSLCCVMVVRFSLQPDRIVGPPVN
jgi:hypothetical protein